MSKRSKFLQRLINFVFLLSIGACIFFGASNITYALIDNGKPDVIVLINKDGSISQSGDLYGEEMWYPGYSVDGLIRIENNYKRIDVKNLGLTVDLAKNVDSAHKGLVYDSFVNNMRLTITKGRLLVFNDVIIENTRLSDILLDPDNSSGKGIELDSSRKFSIGKGDSVDLKYTLQMDMDSGNELEDISADINFMIKLNETPGQPDDDGNNNDNDNNVKDKDDIKDYKQANLIEEPLDVIPSINGHWAHDCIIALIENDILDPDSKSRIRPDDYITRAEAAVLMGRALKLEESKEEDTGYVDNVPTWAKGYVIATAKAKVFKGYPGNIFKSYGNITREEMTAVLIRAFRENLTSDDLLSFIDEATIAKWAYGNVAASAGEGIVTGYTDNTFRPKAYMTRAEAFTIVCRLLGYHEQHNKKL